MPLSRSQYYEHARNRTSITEKFESSGFILEGRLASFGQGWSIRHQPNSVLLQQMDNVALNGSKHIKVDLILHSYLHEQRFRSFPIVYAPPT